MRACADRINALAETGRLSVKVARTRRSSRRQAGL
jgi:hypothetical protein